MKHLSSAKYHGPFEALLEGAEESLLRAKKEIEGEGYDGYFVDDALEHIQRASDIYQEELIRFEMSKEGTIPAKERRHAKVE